MLDPEFQRYRRNYPAFPGVTTCVELLRRRNVQGSYREAVFHDLESHASDHVDELIEAFRVEQDDNVRGALLEVMAEIALPTFLPIFVETLQDSELRYWAILGLKRIDTKEARRALWEAGA